MEKKLVKKINIGDLMELPDAFEQDLSDATLNAIQDFMDENGLEEDDVLSVDESVELTITIKVKKKK
jgi:ribosome assembly protein YihI (activator of Der GTPase)